MENSITVSKHAGITSWIVGGIEVLYTERQVKEEMRGGAPLCAPLFSVQPRPVLGSHLPMHGLTQTHIADLHAFSNETNSWYTESHFKANEVFAWDWTLITTTTVTGGTLEHTMTITREEKCTNPDEMPLSLCFHPYFNTFGNDFSFSIGDVTYTKETLPSNIIDSAFAPLREGQSAILTTDKGVLTITPKRYDEYCLWSDDIHNYFCIEPIYQYREFGLPNTGLQKGEVHKSSCTLVFEPT